MTNDEMDAKVLEAIRSGKTRASAVQAHLLLGPSIAANREVDRSLQRLRKRSAIVYRVAAGWRVR